MVTIEIKLKSWGNSVGAILPKDFLDHQGLHAGDIIKMEILPTKRKNGFGIAKKLRRFEREHEREDIFS